MYIQSFRSIIEATENLNSNLVIFQGVGTFKQLFSPGRRGFEQKFSKNSNPQGVAGGMLKLRFDWYIIGQAKGGAIQVQCYKVFKVSTKTHANCWGLSEVFQRSSKFD